VDCEPCDEDWEPCDEDWEPWDEDCEPWGVGIGMLTWLPDCCETGEGVEQAANKVAMPATTVMRSMFMARLRCVAARDLRFGSDPWPLSSS
jgi:hypothetical protein